MQRYGMIIKVKPEWEESYKQIHAHTWTGVLEQITACHIQNYSIFLRDGYLFSYFEYVGDDFGADMAKMAADPITRAWWKFTDLCQEPVEGAAPGEKWVPMEEVFHHG
ncbi:MAG: L-rhamnose mutarotase [Caldilineaceae bacterium]|nr:L-rhamnose mutarotase [Caldilineaceae bacterium]